MRGASPVLIGALTVLVTIVAVTLAYNATNGLPFVPSYTLHVQAADASELTYGDEVDMGGARVGVVSSVTPARLRDGRAIALLNLRLDRSIEPLPVDSTFTVRLKGAIGLKYLQVTLGHSRRGWPNGATVPLSQESSEVDFDQVLSMFTPPTRAGVQRSTLGLGEALAGRGYDLNEAIGAFVPLLGDLRPVMTNLASRASNLGGFVRGLESWIGGLAPVAQTQAQLFASLDSTFTALAGVAVPSLQQTIADTPPMLSATIADEPTIGPFLADTAALLRELAPGVATLPASAPVLARAFETGRRTLPGTAALDRRLVALSRSLAAYASNAAVQAGLDRLTLTLSRLGPPLAFLTPAQTTCNYVTLFLRNAQSLLSEHVSQGALLRFVQVAITDEPGFESEPSSGAYTGPAGPSYGPLHANPYPYTAAPGQPDVCAAGNERYDARRAQIGNPPALLSKRTQATGGGG
ncbi:MAG TPA: MlaD family protein [Solirubrobacteraceae bacterium]|nr:MlaD family protein [Solirubrobacteraceae bacterium]